MIRKMLQAVLCIILCPLLVAQQSITKPGGAHQSMDGAIVSQVLKLGVGQKVSIREQNGAELNGTITGIGPTAFQLERRDAAAPTYVYYADVARINGAHRRFVQFGKSTDKTWIASVGIASILFLVAFCGDSGSR